MNTVDMTTGEQEFAIFAEQNQNLEEEITLRDYQIEAVEKTKESFKQFRKVLGVAATGAGKTEIFNHLAKEWIKDGSQVLILAHREELLDQPIERLQRSGIFADREQASSWASEDSPLIIGSIQSLIGERRKRFNPDYIIADECHHVLSPSYQSVLAEWPNAKIFGTTATPKRSDKKDLGKFFETIAFEYPLPYLVKRGYLVKPIVLQIPLKIDISRCKTTAGDYQLGELDDAIRPILQETATEILSARGDRKTLVFVPLIHTAKLFSSICLELGARSDFVSGECKDRNEKLLKFRTGETQVLANAMLLTEGYDDPSIQCIVCLRPTQSTTLYQQIVGRGCRVLPDTISNCCDDDDRLAAIAYSDKPNLLLLDFMWLTDRHSLVTPANLVATSDEEAERINKIVSKNQGLFLDLDDMKLQAEEEKELEVRETHAREVSLKNALLKNQKKQKQLIDPIEFALSLHMQSLIEYEPVMPWEAEPITDKQKLALQRVQFDCSNIIYKGHAAMIIDTMHKRWTMNLATPRQIKYLIKFHHPNPHQTTLSEASAFLDSKFGKSKIKE